MKCFIWVEPLQKQITEVGWGAEGGEGLQYSSAF